ncbi:MULTISPECIES: hypothetical protein [unclassified Psychrobacillus]|uniref:hypothetical protein n=1 Tax=unclassified Psychrobacillus TaxID=2636677 RepID=UPI0030F4E62D
MAKYKISHFTRICILILTGMRIEELRAFQKDGIAASNYYGQNYLLNPFDEYEE